MTNPLAEEPIAKCESNSFGWEVEEDTGAQTQEITCIYPVHLPHPANYQASTCLHCRVCMLRRTPSDLETLKLKTELEENVNNMAVAHCFVLFLS